MLANLYIKVGNKRRIIRTSCSAIGCAFIVSCAVANSIKIPIILSVMFVFLLIILRIKPLNRIKIHAIGSVTNLSYIIHSVRNSYGLKSYREDFYLKELKGI